MPDETIEYETTEDPTLKAILKHSDHNDFYASLLRYYEGRGYLTLPQTECLKKDSCFQCNPPRGTKMGRATGTTSMTTVVGMGLSTGTNEVNK